MDGGNGNEYQEKVKLSNIFLNFSNMFDFVGNYGPFFLIFLSIWILYTSKYNTYIYYYVIGLIINTILNLLLKGAIQEPRPAYMSKTNPGAFQKKVKNILNTRHGIPFNLFGMPSGHAQTTLYTLTFMYFVFFNKGMMGLGFGTGLDYNQKHSRGWLVIFTFLIVGGIILFQRVLFGHHTSFQVVVGFIIGVFVGWGFYYIGKQKIKGVLRERDDDNALWSHKIGAGFL